MFFSPFLSSLDNSPHLIRDHIAHYGSRPCNYYMTHTKSCCPEFIIVLIYTLRENFPSTDMASTVEGTGDI